MIHIIYIYLILNSFTIGVHWNELDKPDSIAELLKRILGILIFLLFGSFFYLLVGIEFCVRWLYKKIDPHKAIPFIYNYVFTSKYDNLNQKQLKFLNNNIERWYSRKSPMGDVLRIILKDINKRHPN